MTERGFDDARAGSGLREDLLQVVGEALQSVRGILDLVRGDPDMREAFFGAGQVGLQPQGLLERDEALKEGVVGDPLLRGSGCDGAQLSELAGRSLPNVAA